ncbi:unnamed protein product [Nezara viridula]|uniref:Uncharacterized protein n=1 Tax=Nezara viridula TaxID=85310 RepID=A0A9P0H140_NEZVI|nr:unnamed protein product [Nezara viridula]
MYGLTETWEECLDPSKKNQTMVGRLEEPSAIASRDEPAIKYRARLPPTVVERSRFTRRICPRICGTPVLAPPGSSYTAEELLSGAVESAPAAAKTVDQQR